MCGIIGTIINKRPFTQIKTVEKLFQHQKSRGTQGFGISNSFQMKRIRGETIRAILGWNSYPFMRRFAKGHTLFFHHRFPTSTPNTKETAHPFFNENKTISLMHNGVISNDDELYNTLSDEGHVFESLRKDGKYNDSEVILHQFEKLLAKNKGNIEKAMGEIITTVKGSYAVVIAFKGEKRIHLLKKNNPIIISSDELENYYFSSELEGISNYNTSNTLKEGECNAKGQQLIYQLVDGEYGILDSEGFEPVTIFKVPKPEYTGSSYWPTNEPQRTKTHKVIVWNEKTGHFDQVPNKGEWNSGCRKIASRLLESYYWDTIAVADIWGVISEVESTMVESKHMSLSLENSDKLLVYILSWINYNEPKNYELLHEYLSGTLDDITMRQEIGYEDWEEYEDQRLTDLEITRKNAFGDYSLEESKYEDMEEEPKSASYDVMIKGEEQLKEMEAMDMLINGNRRNN